VFFHNLVTSELIKKFTPLSNLEVHYCVHKRPLMVSAVKVSKAIPVTGRGGP
jgi:hypothetical protein